MFFLTVLSLWTLMHVYAYWRLQPWLSRWPSRLPLALLVFLWLAYPLGRTLERLHGPLPLGSWLEFLGAIWLGILFLLVAALLVADVVSGFGLWQAASWPLRRVFALMALALSLVGLVQGLRAPVVEQLELTLPGLPTQLDGLRLVQLSDLHLGTLLNRRWLGKRLQEVAHLNPDVVVITGDLVDSRPQHVEELLPLLRHLRAPRGVFAVTGNHEFYAGLERSSQLLKEAGFILLRDEHYVVTPGLVMAGVDDLTARRQFGVSHQALVQALGDRPAGACIFLSHTPWQAEEAARAGAGLMLSGHTHGGQIWPFSYLVRLSYPFLQGLYRVGSMYLYVSRGTGTWGPPMRLWQPGEMTLFVLRSPEFLPAGRVPKP